jgi:hypothetical protein
MNFIKTKCTQNNKLYHPWYSPEWNAFLNLHEARFAQYDPDIDDYQLALELIWVRNQLGFEKVLISRFLERWAPPEGQYKNFCVVLQTLLLVPPSQRKNSTGLIVGARQKTGGGEWHKFLAPAMIAMGFTGSVELYDVGLVEAQHNHTDLIVTYHAGFYEGGGGFTWAVDDIWQSMKPGDIVRRGLYESFKDQSPEAILFFHDTEGRLFRAGGVQQKLSWQWREPSCPCPRCCFSEQFPPMIKSFLVYMDSRCDQGLWDHARTIVNTIQLGQVYVPKTGAQVAASILYAKQNHLRSVEGGIAPEKGQITMSDGLKGCPYEPQHRIPSIQEDVPSGGLNLLGTTIRSPTVTDVMTESFYMPMGDYREFVATGRQKDDYAEYVRQYPHICEGPSSKKIVGRYVDVASRSYIGEEYTGGVWCWREKKMCAVPHQCPDVSACKKTHQYRAYMTYFARESYGEKYDLCQQCEFLVKRTVRHVCRVSLVLRDDYHSFLISHSLRVHARQMPSVHCTNLHEIYPWYFNSSFSMVEVDPGPPNPTYASIKNRGHRLPLQDLFSYIEGGSSNEEYERLSVKYSSSDGYDMEAVRSDATSIYLKVFKGRVYFCPVFNGVTLTHHRTKDSLEVGSYFTFSNGVIATWVPGLASAFRELSCLMFKN